jgi:hypothetical protein
MGVPLEKDSGVADTTVKYDHRKNPVTSQEGVTARVYHFERTLCLKIDLYLLLPFLSLNFLSLMGRTNIGAALIQNLPQDLRLGPKEVFLCISIPVVPLILLEIPSNLLMRALEKRYGIGYMKYLSAITILLGASLLGRFLSTRKTQERKFPACFVD